MPRKKGAVKTGGRGKGTPNKVTSDLRTWVNMLIDNNREQLEKDLKALEPRERWAVIEKLMSYTMPKMQSIEAKIEYDKLSDEQLNTIINKITVDL